MVPLRTGWFFHDVPVTTSTTFTRSVGQLLSGSVFEQGHAGELFLPADGDYTEGSHLPDLLL